MPSIYREALVPYHAQEMYDLVNAVEHYKSFLPWCVDSEVISVSSGSLVGRLTLGQAGIYQSFSTRNALSPPHKIVLHLLDGPFDSLEGIWSFSSLGQVGCKVSLALEFELHTRFFENTFAKLFMSATSRLVEAFCQRAKEIYGERSLF